VPAPARGPRPREAIRRVLVANRGEIAVRIIRACRELGFETVAVAGDADLGSLHARLADRLERLGPSDPAESYLHHGRIIDAARRSGADTLHPGYGFLSESAAFADAVAAAGLRWVGPPAAVIARLGDKITARALAEQAGVSPIPGAADTASGDAQALAAAADGVGFPLMVKAAAGGGGRGMRLVERAGDLPAALASAEREARAAFGDGRLFLERRLDDVRHVEVQILGDGAGHVAALGERECSIQRRHQKLIEEAPSPGVDPALRSRLAAAAVAVARAAEYVNAGTVEFLLTPAGRFYFLEVNTRLQVEHPVTEFVTGVDLVKAQFGIAAGDTLDAIGIPPAGPGDARRSRESTPSPRGHAIECRVCAEDSAAGFRPSPGPILVLDEPRAPGVRVDSGLREGWTVPAAYDSLLAKVIVWDRTRAGAIARMDRALAGYVILGCGTNLGFLRDVMRHEAFSRGETTTNFLRRHFAEWRPHPSVRAAAAAAALVSAQRPASPRYGGDPAAEARTASWDPWDAASGWRAGGSRG
jgi:acetyl/propionyl-CoA carboxylase alpha subunit